MSLIVNFFSGPSCGKSVWSADIFSRLKKRHIETELALEFAKDLVWEENLDLLKNQIYVFGNQLHRIERLNNKVDVIITDSPILLSIIYKQENLSETFDKLVLETFNSYNNLNYFVNRSTTYNPNGRKENYEEAIKKDNQIKDLLDKNNIQYKVIKNNELYIEEVLDDIIRKINIQ